MPQHSRVYTSVNKVIGPLIVVDGVENVAYGEVVEISLPFGEKRLGQVLETRTSQAVVQVFGGTGDLDTDITSVRFTGEILKIALSEISLEEFLTGSKSV